ncbi:hypothetical protein MAPG_00091 [Magnaporthiopsis poae ATCC 64411]|uniref:Uncharacterized protein n=1 Tax=Magnaporthiopsis poae (strain ATCC 64411 / 73-15) TaxID=644358 RepID=A0A0C4DK29_MAGP6|nr:hypothetical protein MAPG_00091 [Magnaporthiopsis poae ATCC 64411]
MRRGESIVSTPASRAHAASPHTLSVSWMLTTASLSASFLSAAPSFPFPSRGCLARGRVEGAPLWRRGARFQVFQRRKPSKEKAGSLHHEVTLQQLLIFISVPDVSISNGCRLLLLLPLHRFCGSKRWMTKGIPHWDMPQTNVPLPLPYG